MNNDLKQKYLNVISDNINVGDSNLFGEIIILITGMAMFCFAIFLFANKISEFIVSKIPDKTQIKIEKALPKPFLPTKEIPSEKIVFLNNIKHEIISFDKKLQNKSNFEIYEVPQEEVNAFVTTNGTIYFTEGLLNKVDDEKTLVFVLAHEMGHYAHRDHLKSISKSLIVAMLQTLITSGQEELSTICNSLTSVEELNYSRNQEKQADIYAAKVIYKLYGNLDGAENFFNILESEKEVPELFKYFSTHPSINDRLELIKSIKRKL